jgi:hypothetical protein
MKKFPKKSIYSLHRQVANSQFDELKYEGKDEHQMRKAFVSQYFGTRTKIKKEK